MKKSNLTLGRKLGEKILIVSDPHNIEVTVVKIKNGFVSLRFTANPDVPIYRWELAESLDIVPPSQV